MVLLAELWLPGAFGVGVMEGGTTAWESPGTVLPSRKGGQGSEEGDIKDGNHPSVAVGPGRIWLSWLCLLQAQHHVSHPTTSLPAACGSSPFTQLGQEGNVSSWRLVVVASLG